MILRQRFIYRQDLRANPDVLYLFGDNLLRKGFGGQAREMRGEPNAVGIATKRAPGRRPQDYFTDAEFGFFSRVITDDFARARDAARLGKSIVIPLDGIGTGLSEMPERCPALFAFIEEQIQLLESA